jgi:small GTP-binding protein
MPKFIKSNEQDKCDIGLKFIILGDSNIGKTRILNLFLENDIISNQTIGYEIKKIGIEYKNKKINIQLWDTSGIEKYRNNKQNLYKNTSGIILIYDCNNEESFLNLKDYLLEIDKYKSNDIPIILLCLKNKKECVIKDNLGGSVAQDYCHKFFICNNYDVSVLESVLLYLCEKNMV